MSKPTRLDRLRAIERALAKSEDQTAAIDAALEETRRELALERAAQKTLTPRDIFAATQGAARQDAPEASARALLALRDLLASFLDATNTGCPESMKAMSIDQTRLLNQLHLAVGL